MVYGAETCYLGAIDHGADPRVQKRKLNIQGYKCEYILGKKSNNKKIWYVFQLCAYQVPKSAVAHRIEKKMRYWVLVPLVRVHAQ